MSLEGRLEWIRDRGWMVAIHNDYQYQGKIYTFWLFTKISGYSFFVKSEGCDGDSTVVGRCMKRIKNLERKYGPGR